MYNMKINNKKENKTNKNNLTKFFIALPPLSIIILLS